MDELDTIKQWDREAGEPRRRPTEFRATVTALGLSIEEVAIIARTKRSYTQRTRRVTKDSRGLWCERGTWGKPEKHVRNYIPRWYTSPQAALDALKAEALGRRKDALAKLADANATLKGLGEDKPYSLEEELYRALSVIVQDPKIHDWLEEHDPQALKQAKAARERAKVAGIGGQK